MYNVCYIVVAELSNCVLLVTVVRRLFQSRTSFIPIVHTNHYLFGIKVCFRRQSLRTEFCVFRVCGHGNKAFKYGHGSQVFVVQFQVNSVLFC